MQYKFRLIIVIFGLVLLNGCSSDNSASDIEKARAYCLDENGTIQTIELGEDNSTEVCITTHTGDFDGGSEEYSFTCELMDFYTDSCEVEVEEDNNFLVESVYIGNSQHYEYYNKVEDVLNNLDNTGYTHRPFLLSPDIGESEDKYNLFLDCSGFVGYYVIQELTPNLYDMLPRKYSCGALSVENNVTTGVARPLAADFVDHIKASDIKVTFDNTAKNSDENQCWGRVENIEDARSGDVIAYVHSGNIDTETKYCCAKEKREDNSSYHYVSTVMKADDTCDTANGNRIIYKTKLDDNGNHKSTGHVMFITESPYRSKKCKDTGQCKYHWIHLSSDYQWVVHVADSTNVKHTSDSRKVGLDNSKYNDNSYHAWTEGTVEKCKDGSYHRKCTDHSTTKEESVSVKGSSKPNHPTGVGTGYIYVNDALDGYRTKYSADISNADIVIGRPVKCD